MSQYSCISFELIFLACLGFQHVAVCWAPSPFTPRNYSLHLFEVNVFLRCYFKFFCVIIFFNHLMEQLCYLFVCYFNTVMGCQFFLFPHNSLFHTDLVKLTTSTNNKNNPKVVLRTTFPSHCLPDSYLSRWVFFVFLPFSGHFIFYLVLKVRVSHQEDSFTLTDECMACRT